MASLSSLHLSGIQLTQVPQIVSLYTAIWLTLSKMLLQLPGEQVRLIPVLGSPQVGYPREQKPCGTLQSVGRIGSQITKTLTCGSEFCFSHSWIAEAPHASCSSGRKQRDNSCLRSCSVEFRLKFLEIFRIQGDQRSLPVRGAVPQKEPSSQRIRSTVNDCVGIEPNACSACAVVEGLVTTQTLGRHLRLWGLRR